MENNCARCGRKVRLDANYVRVYQWGSNAVFDGACFIALLKSHGPEAAEQAAGRGDGHARRASAIVNDRESTK